MKKLLLIFLLIIPTLSKGQSCPGAPSSNNYTVNCNLISNGTAFINGTITFGALSTINWNGKYVKPTEGGTGMITMGSNGQMTRSNGTGYEWFTPDYVHYNDTVNTVITKHRLDSILSIINSSFVSLSGSYSNPSWINSLAWSKITGAPAFITTESDPVWTGVAAGYRTKDQNDLLYQPIGIYLTSASSLNPANVAQTASYRFATDTEKVTWNAKLSAEVDGSISNEIQSLSLVGQNLSISGGNTVTLPSSGTVTSIGITGTDFSISGSPVTTSGNIALSLANTGVIADTYDRVTVSAKGLVTAGTKRSIPVAIASGARTIGTSYQISTTQWSSITLSGSASVSILVLGNASGTLFAEVSPNGTTGWVFAGNIAKNTAALLGLSTTNGGSVTVSVPPGYYYRMSTTSSVSGVTNTATFTFDGGSYYTE